MREHIINLIILFAVIVLYLTIPDILIIKKHLIVIVTFLIIFFIVIFLYYRSIFVTVDLIKLSQFILSNDTRFVIIRIPIVLIKVLLLLLCLTSSHLTFDIIRR